MSEENTHDDEPSFDFPEAEVEALKAEVQSLKDQVLRFAAEAENTKRRAEREMNDARAYAITKFARDLLGVADIFDRALMARPADTGDASVNGFVQGIEMTAKELQGAFERNGLKRVTPGKGEKFDPHKHQAMMEQPGTDVAPGAVVQTMQAGYELLGRLVRPAMVVVAAKVAGQSAPPAGEAPANPYAPHEDEDGGGTFDTRA
jgi:molecular chaperone GrpE